MGSFRRLDNPFRKSGSASTPPAADSSSRFGNPFQRAASDPVGQQDAFAPAPYPTSLSSSARPADQDPQSQPVVTRDRVIAASIGAAVVGAIAIVGFAVAGGPNDPTPAPAAAYPTTSPTSRESSPPREPADEPTVTAVPAGEQGSASSGEPTPAPAPGDLSPAPVAEPAPAEAAPVEAAPAPAAEPTLEPAPVEAAPEPVPAPVQEVAPPVSDVYYANCAAVRAAGAAPISQGSPGYGTHLDRDGDGIGCDKG